ncbi:hypothetical protein SCLCIDRAFT_1185807 [Scleroderma citrinum Foug A]|uniref:CxC1-like cysteine cluster associated with KDZ transposases domain-containing protein n=1 Tax=Scleroderma citrinum Foug A TaxID=1036808 RepID=A0A0C2ZCQ0_9AGAM|nr:hypothetical protein SCLCIDRAFT_1185807 [Scleroderma citrinum Foug A]
MFEDQGMDVHYDLPAPFNSPDSDHDSGSDDEFSRLSEHVSGWCRADAQDHRDCTELQTNQWNAQITHLVDAYLDFHSRDSHDGFPAEEPAEIEVPAVLPPGSVSGIELVDIFTRCKATLIARTHHVFPNENLIYHGYLGCSPVHPTVAISLHTLAAFRQTHRACPRFSIQAQCKALCHLHNVPYCPYLFHQFSHAYDIYLEIVHQVNQNIRVALNHNTQEWRL